MGAVYRVIVSGVMPAATGDVLEQRFADVHVTAARGHTVVECSICDQSALRALLTLVWDLGGTVLLLTVARTFPSEEESR